MSLIFIDPGLERQEHDNNIKVTDNNKNLLNLQLLTVFKNVEELRINTTDFDLGDYVYPFRILSLLKMIEKTSINDITITAGNNWRQNHYNWISSMYKSSSLTEIAVRFEFQLKEEKGAFHHSDSRKPRFPGTVYF